MVPIFEWPFYSQAALSKWSSPIVLPVFDRKACYIQRLQRESV
jgi:hypothetical protein